MTITTCVFDAYGTLFDVSAAARQLAERPGHEDFATHWPRIARDWRAKQLEYSWLRSVSGTHLDFWQVTQDGLDWALEAAGLDPKSVLREDLLALYWELAAYPEVPMCLSVLKAQGYATAILSNGSPDMLEGAVTSAGLEMLLDATLSVEAAGVYKPHRSVYDLVGARFDCSPKDVLFVSANGWDAGYAALYGFQTVWVNRAGAPMDRLPGTPQHVVADLSDLPELAGNL